MKKKSPMNRLDAIKEEIRALSRDELVAFRDWFDGFDDGRARAAVASPGEDIGANPLLDLVVLAPKENASRCRVLGSELELTFRQRTWGMAPGEIVTVRARKQWRYGGRLYLSGDVDRSRIDVKALDLSPLELRDEYPWDPTEEYWGEEGEPLESWVEPIIARGTRPSFEMEQVIPGVDPENWDDDPILEAAELADAGRRAEARKLLVGLLESDLRCLDAHAHLGNLVFDRFPDVAIRHYELGSRIGELSLGDRFEGVLPWARIDNRPYLRCLHGLGLCLWRLDRSAESVALFERMLWLNPSDNQGVRFLLPRIREGRTWEEEEELP